MKKQKRAISALLVTGMVAMSLSGCSGEDIDVVNKAGAVDKKDNSKEEEKTKELADKVVSGLKENKVSTGKDETVYVVMDNDGSVSSITVSDVLKNIKSGTVNDVSELKDINNLKGEEEFSNSGTDVTWQSEGNDITYQGTTDKELPVGLDISYKLDGKKVEPSELAGATGHIEISYNYTNNTGSSKEVNGEMKDVIVPFVAASGMMLSSDKCANVTIDNGKVIEEGNNIVVVGYAIPGLKDCITDQIEDSDKIFDKVNIGDSFTVEADVADFETDMALTVVLPDVIGSEELEDINTDEISDKIDELSDASEQLENGSSKLDDGAADLKDGTKELNKGASKLENGAADLKDGVNDLNKGAKDLNKGAEELNKGAKDLNKGAKALNKGAKDIDDGVNSLDKGAKDLDKGAKDLADGGKTLSNGAKDISTNLGTLSTGAASVESGAKQVYDGVGTLKTNVETFQTKAGELVTGIETVASGITTVDAYMKQIVAGFEDTEEQTGLVNGSKQVADGVKELIGLLKNSTQSIDAEIDNIMLLVKQSSGIEDIDTLSAKVQSLEAAIKAKQDTVPVTTILTNATGGKITSYEQYSALCQANYSIAALTGVKTKLNSMVSENSAKLAKLEAGAAGVASGINTVYTGLSTLSDNVTTLSGGGNQLVAGAASVNQGFVDLLNGITTLHTGSKTLYDGTKTLNDGAGKLNTGAVTLSQGASTLYAGITTLKSGTATLAEGTGKLKEGSGTLYKGSSDLYNGTGTLSKGAESLYKGTGTLYKGTGDLKDGAGKLYNGLGDLHNGTEELFDGTKTLKDGTKELSDGMLEFNKEAITPVTDLFGDTLSDAYDLVYSIAEEGDAYKNFTGISEDMDGSVKFIYKTNGIKKTEEE